MALAPGDWTVVIVGSWNRAILTPSMVSRKLFRLDDGTPVKVAVQLDVVAPYQISHEEIVVVPFRDKLIVATLKPNFVSLHKAMKVALNAVEELPRTPYTAAGFNLRYKSKGPIEALQSLTSLETWDNRISDEGLSIDERSVTRAVKWGDGKIKVTITQQEDLAHSILLNFDLQSENVDLLKNWISAEPSQIETQTEKVFKTIGLTSEDIEDA